MASSSESRGPQSTTRARGAQEPSLTDGYRQLVEMSLDLLCIASTNGYFKQVNPAFSEILGWTEDELLERPFLEFVHPEDRDATTLAVETLAGGGNVVDFVNRYRTSEGAHRWIEWRASVNEDGLIYAIGRDVTDRRRAETLMRETQGAARVGGWELDFRTNDLYWTDETYRIHEVEPESYNPTVESAIGFYAPQSLPVIARAVEHAKATGEGYDIELQLITAKSRLVDVRAVGKVVFDENGPARAYGSFQDITEQKRTEREVQEAHALLLAAIEQSPAGILIADAPEGRIRIANSAALGIRGGEHRVLTDIPIENHPENWQTFHADGSPCAPEDLPLSRAILYGETTKDVEVVIRHENGEDRWVLGNAAPVRDGDGNIIAGVVVFPDITDRKLAERELRRLQLITEATSDFIGSCDPEGRPIYMNRAMRAAYGIGPEDRLPWESISELHPPAQFQVIRDEALETAKRGGIWSGESAILASGTREVSVSQVIMGHCNDHGEIEFFSTIMRDQTEHNELQAKLLHSQKLEGIGRLAGGIAHDFNNLLTIILGNVDMLTSNPEVASQSAEAIRQASEQAARLTGQLLAFARKQVATPRVINLNEEIEKFGDLLRRLIGEDIRLVIDAPLKPSPIKIDPGHLEQIVMNLAVNARDAMESGGKLEIRIRRTHLEHDEAATEDVSPAGDYVELAVSDSGCGIPDATLEHVFEPFFTTKEHGKGTGLGLSTVHGVVQQNGGRIDIETEVGQGTTFLVYLPLAEAGEDAQPERGEGPESRGGETLLLVEDEKMVRDVAAQMLTRLGYHVLVAADGREAVTLAKEHGAEIDGLVTDVVLPNETGRDIAEKLLEIHRDLKVLYVSGYTPDRVDLIGATHGENFLQKPYPLSALAAAIRRMLSS